MYKLIEKQTDKRLVAWRNLRQHLETSTRPFEDTIEFFQQFPHVKVYTDPYDRSTWPTAWELIEENEYCPFNLILAVCYTLKLCKRFEHIDTKITVSVDNINKTVYYLLFIDDKVYGYDYTEWIPAANVPATLKHIKIYNIDHLH
jgi:hypothetical protein